MNNWKSMMQKKYDGQLHIILAPKLMVSMEHKKRFVFLWFIFPLDKNVT